MKVIDNYLKENIPKEKQNALISVCVAVYNSKDYLKKCIDSIIAQTYHNLEIILVDDGSSDGSEDICDEYAVSDSRIKVIHKPNGGLFSSRNAGIDNARGEYICFLDGDDYIDPDMYEAMLSALLNEDADMTVCRYRQVYEDGIEDASTDKAVIFEGHELLEQYLKEDEKILIQNSAWNKLYKKELIDTLRFPERWYEDMLYTPELLSLVSKAVYLDKAYHNYICDRKTSIMNKGINEKVFTDLIPNYYDRSTFLDGINRHDLALISDYYFYKKILVMIKDAYRSKADNKKADIQRLDECIRNGKDRFDEIFGIEFANPNEYKKLKLYLASPLIYRLIMHVNEKLIIPLKQK